MLIIRQEQMGALTEARKRAFEDRILDQLRRSHLAEWGRRNEAATRQLVRAAVERALAYGFDDEYNITRFVDVTFLLGDGFDQLPSFNWAQSILNNSALPPTGKMDWLRCHVAVFLSGDAKSGGRNG